MDAALGPPAKMAEHRDDLTPMMSQYYDLCARYDDCLVLFQVGDFYETFCEAAEASARLLEITLTQREDSTGTYPMAGIPIDNAESYVETLLDAGYRVAIADQVEDAEEASGLVDRAVTRIVTPGTLTEDELLDAEDNNFVACLTAGYGLALLDVSTGDFFATGVDSLDAVRDELGRFAPAEAIVDPAIADDVPDDLFPADCLVAPYERRAFELDRARERVDSYFGSPDALLASDAEVRACGALLSYAEYARGGEDGRLEYLTHLTRYDPREHLLLDSVALRSLELFERRTVHGDPDTTLVGVLDETSCALGSRKLKDWLRRPLIERDRIEARLDAVEELTGRVAAREEVRDLLRDVYDVERLITRVSRGQANARDLRSLLATLDVVPAIDDAMVDVESDALVDLRDRLDHLDDVRELIRRAIRENPPPEITEGGIIRPGYDEDLDALRETERDGKEWIDALEERERDRTGIDSLKVGYNSVHGYYIEVTDPNLDRVPDDYTRRQTLKNSERFVTPELKRREDEIVRAEGRADDREYELFREVRGAVADESDRVQALAETLAKLDVLVAFAEVAAKYDYARPEIGDPGTGFAIRGGRHPVVERTEERFVPNDTRLDDDAFFAIITGPNMSGKSTYMRQVALIVLLAQTGCFVPADDARIELVDRIFTRVGASDDIAGGRSTFMIEMAELSAILREATDRSLVLLDEVGRGTSTTDGLAIARAVTEYVHDEIGATTLFATHHHELTAMADELPGVANFHFAATREDGAVAFEHSIEPGASAASYGIEVAEVAGVPDAVVERSRDLLAADSSAEAVERGSAEPPHPDARRVGAATDGGDASSATDDPLRRALADADVATMTPLDALNELARLKRLANGD